MLDDLMAWFARETGIPPDDAAFIFWWALFVLLMYVFVRIGTKRNRRPTEFADASGKTIGQKFLEADRDMTDALAKERKAIAESIAARDAKLMRQCAETTAKRYHLTKRGEEFMNSVAFYDRSGSMIGCVSMDWDNQEIDVHVAAGCSASKSDNGKLTVIRLPPSSSASSPELRDTAASG